MLDNKASWKSLARLCRSLATLIESGVPIQQSLATLSKRSGDQATRNALKAMEVGIKGGMSLSEAISEQGTFFPELFRDLTEVAEDTGNLAEVFTALALHYENLISMKQQFIGQITMPVIQFVAATGILALLIYLLGMIAAGNNTKPMDVLGLGLTGTSGALMFLGIIYGSIFLLVVVYFIIVRGFGKGKFLYDILLRIPVMGKCLEAFALARFSWAFALTQESGMRIIPSLKASFRATSNPSYIGVQKQVCSMLQEGEELATSLAETRIFPEEYIQIVSVSEQSGTVPETLKRISPQLEDQARRTLSALTTALGWLVWALVAGLIIYAIFQIFVNGYLNLIKEGLKGV